MYVDASIGMDQLVFVRLLRSGERSDGAAEDVSFTFVGIWFCLSRALVRVSFVPVLLIDNVS